jgi:(1->4)-alpha-D-glucan 1-alpha-D-glucosylmutase
VEETPKPANAIESSNGDAARRPPRRVPQSTYRLQFQREFTFADAGRLVPYLAQLGITDCYCSPYLTASPGSLHGYDICDHNRLNPELGSIADYDAFTSTLAAHGMGQLLDFVPNHMGIDPRTNPWWRDVLENGPSSRYARHFDIDWEPVKPELKNKVLLPILGDQYGRVLARGEIRVHFENGALVLRYGDQELPVNPRQAVMLLRLDLEALRLALGENSPHLREFLSILTELKNLPAYTETDPERIAERQREKEVARARLAHLVAEAPRLRQHIDAALEAFNGVPGEATSFDRLHDLLEAQAYRLAYWRTAAHEINYRRFFDVNGLAGLRMEDPEVFAATHQLMERLLRSGAVTELRIDHPDGLSDPAEYLGRLQALALAAHASRKPAPAVPGEDDPLYIVAEKILSDGESLRSDWAVCGTTGYGFLNAVNGLFVDADQARSLKKIYVRFTGEHKPFGDVAYESKKLIMATTLASELNVLAHTLDSISESDRNFRDYTLNSLRDVLSEVIACFRVYRTYVNPSGWTPEDRRSIESAIAMARHRNPAIESSIFDFLRDVLLPCDLGGPPGAGTSEAPAAGPTGEDCRRRLSFAMKFQQYTAPVHAKSLEDTAFYRYNQLLSLNEVGGNPGRVGHSPEEFHEANRHRLHHWPFEMLATATHDTKLGEDARARLNVLSELPDEWRKALSRWVRVTATHHTLIDGEAAPDRNDRYRFYQALIGTWPPDHTRPALPSSDYVARVQAYMIKAAKEAKVHTSWINENRPYEDAVVRFVSETLAGRNTERFLAAFLPLQARVAVLGMVNSLSQLLLKLTAPGVPDFYQGTELWDLSLTDPDNRRPVDFEHRRTLIEGLGPLLTEALSHPRRPSSSGGMRAVVDLLQSWPDGRIKLYVTALGLHLRRDHPDLFLRGTYVPLETSITVPAGLIAFARQVSGHAVVTVVPRLAGRVTSAERPLPVGPRAWLMTRVRLPPDLAERSWRNLLTGEPVKIRSLGGSQWMLAADVLSSLPVALLWAD